MNIQIYSYIDGNLYIRDYSMRAYFYTFLGVSIFLFAVVMTQIRAAISDIKKEQEAWLAVRVR